MFSDATSVRWLFEMIAYHEYAQRPSVSTRAMGIMVDISSIFKANPPLIPTISQFLNIFVQTNEWFNFLLTLDLFQKFEYTLRFAKGDFQRFDRTWQHENISCTDFSSESTQVPYDSQEKNRNAEPIVKEN